MKPWALLLPMFQPTTHSLCLSHRGDSRCSASAPMTPHCHIFANFTSFLGTSVLAAHLLNSKKTEDVTDGALGWMDVMDAKLATHLSQSHFNLHIMSLYGLLTMS